MQSLTDPSCPRCGSSVFRPHLSADAIERDIRIREDFVYRRFDYEPERSELMDLTEFMHGDVGQLVVCARCGIVAREEDTDAHYADDAYDHELMGHMYPRYLDAFRAKQKQYQELLPPKAEVIEAGSHLGAFLEVAEDWDWRPTGLDIGEDTSSFARRRGLRVRRETAEDAKLPPHAAHGLFLWNCFDQLERPADLLRSAHRILGRHGLLVVRTPNVAFYERLHQEAERNPQAIKDLAYNNLLGFPYRWGFTPLTLTELCETHGFEPLIGFDSTLLTMPFPEPSARVKRETAEVNQKYESVEPVSPKSLKGPWIEVVCRKKRE